MTKRGSKKKGSSPIGRISPQGYIAQQATNPPDGRKKNKTKNLFG